MDAPDTYDPQELGRRQQAANVRRQREIARRALLTQLLDTQRQALELKTWISACLRQDSDTTSPEFRRMIEWASGQLDELEGALRPRRLTEMLRAQDLFPETDPLNDTKGGTAPASHLGSFLRTQAHQRGLTIGSGKREEGKSMMTLLRGLHAIAVQRGNDLRPELLKAVLSSPGSADIDQAPRSGGHDAKPFIVIHGGQGDTAAAPSLRNSFKR